MMLAVMSAMGQCERLVKKGTDAFSAKKYSEAKNYFTQAKTCPAIQSNKVEVHKLDSWIADCDKAIKKAQKKQETASAATSSSGTGTGTTGSQKTGTNSQPQPPKSPGSITIDQWTAASLCVDGRSGVQYKVTFQAHKLGGRTVYARCYLSPAGGGENVLAGKDPGRRWTLPGDLSGRDETIAISSDDEAVTASFFVPFSVMDFGGNYEYQIMNAGLYLCEGRPADDPDDIVVISGGEYHEKFLLTPASVTVAGSTERQVLEVNCEAVTYDLGIAACGGEVVWGDHPKWLTPDEGGRLEIERNTDPMPRDGLITVSAPDGGNVVEVLVRQGGYIPPVVKAKINKVWQEADYIEPRYGAHQLRVHVDLDVDGLAEKNVRVYVLFYTPDGETQLMNANGEHVSGFAQGVVNFDNANFDDFTVTIMNNRFQKASNIGLSQSASYFVAVSADEGQTWLATSGPYTVNW